MGTRAEIVQWPIKEERRGLEMLHPICLSFLSYGNDWHWVAFPFVMPRFILNPIGYVIVLVEVLVSHGCLNVSLCSSFIMSFHMLADS